ncbi:hypothetical protein [Marinicella rhabdoformis]|uniref:hypothetical protein n=1 Tax=Marinicella rhabdoformis TaxID=2580566 RepID=UPI0012AECCFE|nr:hypothetical protein [Marinicella rhabdoformis]
MSTVFSKIPSDPNSTILFQYQGVFDDVPVCYRTWRIDDIQGDSIIFQHKDLFGQEDRQIIKKIQASHLVDKSKTIAISRNHPDFVFVNFNFSVV